HAIVELLLNAGALVDARSADGSTALLWAVQKGDVDTALLLCFKGADIGATNDQGLSPGTAAREKQAGFKGLAGLSDAAMEAGHMMAALAACAGRQRRQ